MRLSAKILKNVNTVNSWVYSSQAYFGEDQSNLLYIQVVDLDQSIEPSTEKSQAFPQYPIRYISLATVSSLEATFPALEDDSKFSVVATQPFPQDKSIWLFSLSSSQVPSSGNVDFKLTEDGVVKNFRVRNAISVGLNNVGGCG